MTGTATMTLKTQILTGRKEWTPGELPRYSPVLRDVPLPDHVEYRWTDARSSPPVKVTRLARSPEVTRHAEAGDLLVWTFDEAWTFIPADAAELWVNGHRGRDGKPLATEADPRADQRYLMAAVEAAGVACRGEAAL